MAGPWERYQQHPAAAPDAGPWAKYQQQGAEEAPSTPRAYNPFADDESALPPLPGEEVIETFDRGRGRPGYVEGVRNALGEMRDMSPDDIVRGTTGALVSMGRQAASVPLGSIAGATLGYGKAPQEQERIAQETAARVAGTPGQNTQRVLGAVGAVAAPVTRTVEEYGADAALAPLAPELRAFSAAPARVPGDARVPGNLRRRGPSPDQPMAEAGSAGEPVQGTAAGGRKAGLASVSGEAPSTAALKEASRAAYQRARDTGAVIRAESFDKAKSDLSAMLQREGIDPTLHPSATAALARIMQTDGPIPLDQIETLRRIAKDAEGALAPADRRLASKIVESLDDYAESIDPRHLAQGTPDAVAAFKEARGLWARARKADTIAELVDRAETKAGAHYTQAGMEHSLRQEFKALALNPKKLRMFSKDEQAAIKNIAKGGKWENSLRNLGKFDPSAGGMSAFMSALLAGGGAIPTGGFSLLLPAAGFAAKRGTTRITAKKVAQLDEMVRRGPMNAFAREQSASPSPQNVFSEPRTGEHIEMSGNQVRRWRVPIEDR